MHCVDIRIPHCIPGFQFYHECNKNVTLGRQPALPFLHPNYYISSPYLVYGIKIGDTEMCIQTCLIYLNKLRELRADDILLGSNIH